ncbi:hypothetical protein AB0J01_28165 [Streptomyces sp. NPDC050204]|uniref:hypothetical protein n=1 Tax=Streptomyces sp. NPDC050204 TaxID=3155514 RepID=UPI00341C29CE
MAKYRVTLSTHASTTVDIETDVTDPHQIAALAAEQADAVPCHHCETDFTVGDDWKPVLVDGIPAITSLDQKEDQS